MSTGNAAYKAFLEKRYEKNKNRFGRSVVRGKLSELYGLQRQAERAAIENKFKEINRSANKNEKQAIRNARTKANANHAAHMEAIRAWAEYATTSVNGHLFNSKNYKNFRKYYISELNRLALGHGADWKGRGVGISEYLRKKKAQFENWRAQSKANKNLAKKARENANRASAKASELRKLQFKQKFNNPMARLRSKLFRKHGNAITEASNIQAKINALKAKAESEKAKANALTKLGQAQAAAGAAAQAQAAAAAANNLTAQLSVGGAAAVGKAVGIFGSLTGPSSFKPNNNQNQAPNTNNNNNQEFHNAQQNLNLLNNNNTEGRNLLAQALNSTRNRSQRQQAVQNLLAKHPELIFLGSINKGNLKLVKKNTRAGGLAAMASTKI